MPRKKEPYKIPFTRKHTGGVGLTIAWSMPADSVPSQISNWEKRKNGWEQNYEWRDNVRFEANLKFIRMSYGGKVLWENTETGAHYWMNQSGLAVVLKSKSVIYGAVLGTWIFKKHGNTYSVFPIVK